ncbi:MAG: endonuclease/exonuclease/phosphatase family protein [Candidatus Riflebacteria bacterium]|nr:endonuclease/exonuclease/phosphatase family protein [Candidatus Riflebacteria bacterium]
MDEQIPRRCRARHEPEALLGQGGCGAVYLVTQRSLQRKAFRKLLLDGMLADQEQIDRFLAEARITAALEHRSIVRIYDHGARLGLPPRGLMRPSSRAEATSRRSRDRDRLPVRSALYGILTDLYGRFTAPGPYRHIPRALCRARRLHREAHLEQSGTRRARVAMIRPADRIGSAGHGNTGRLMVIATIGWLGVASTVSAVTYVTIDNRTPHELRLRTTQTGGTLSTSRWSRTRSVVRPNEKVEVLRFNRDRGITSGEYFYFHTEVSMDGASVELQQAVYGLAIDSRLWQSAGTDEWFGDREVHSQSFKVSSGWVLLRYRAVATSGNDDLLYVFTVAPTPPRLVDREFRVLAYNTALLPTGAEANGQSERAAPIGRAIQGYDAVILSELFDDDARRKVLRTAKEWYPFRTSVVDRPDNVLQDGGVVILSRWPIVRQRQMVFDSSAGVDSFANKGVVYGCIERPDRRYHLFGTHTQAHRQHSALRARQFLAIRQFVDEQKIRSDEPVLIGGDMNVDRGSPEFSSMLSLLAARMPDRMAGHPFTYDFRLNDLCTEKDQEYLDYVLHSETHLAPRRSRVVTVFMRPAQPVSYVTPNTGGPAAGPCFPTLAVRETGYLSDHFAVEATYEFETGPTRLAVSPALSAGTSRGPARGGEQVSLLGVASDGGLAGSHP